MKALTLKHPWPWAICVLGKRIENRTWKPSPARLAVGDWFAIHGGKWPTSESDVDDLHDEAVDLANSMAHLLPGGNDVPLNVLEFCGIVAVCRFGGLVTDSSDPWFEGPFGWRLLDLIVLPEPIPCKGAQGLWDIPEDVLAEVRKVYWAAFDRRSGVPHA